MIVQRFLGLFAEPNQTKQTKSYSRFWKKKHLSFIKNKVVVAGRKNNSRTAAIHCPMAKRHDRCAKLYH